MNWVLVFSSVAVTLVITGTTLAAHGIKCLCVDTEKDFQVIWINVIEFILASAMMVMAGGLLHVASLSPARSHTFKSLYNQLTFNRNLRTSNASVRQRFHAWITHTAKHQDLTLKEILQKSSDTVYGTDHSFRRIRTTGEFRSQHQLTDYKSYEKYVQLVLEGKDNVLFPEPVNYLSITSGTSSGRSKIFPRNSESYTNTILMSLLCVKAEMYSYPGMYSLQKLHDVRVIDPPKEIAPGVLRGPASSSSYPPWPFTASPSPVYTIATEKESLYVHAFFGLLEPDLKVLSFLTASVALNFFRMVEERWGELCDDVERGTLSMELSITDDLRRQLQCHIRPDPARATAVREALRYGGQNMVLKLWPGCCLIKGSASGTYENSAKLLQRYIGVTPIFSPYHIATEALYGVCVNSRDSDSGVVEYTINPQANFYEFIPEEDTAKEQPDTFLATEVKIGKTYEIVVTTRTGLFRYRSQDLVKITGYEETAPKYKFCQRIGDFLSANTDRYPEVVFNEAVRMAEEKWTGTIQQYMATENIHVDKLFGNIPKNCFYYIFVELVEDVILTDTEKKLLGTCLASCHEDYGEMVAYGGVLEPVVLQMERGTFEGVRRLILSVSPEASSVQYKPAKFIRKPEVLNYLLKHHMK